MRGTAFFSSSLGLFNTITPEGPETRFRSTSGTPDLQSSLTPSDLFMDLLFSGWDPDLPDPDTLNH